MKGGLVPGKRDKFLPGASYPLSLSTFFISLRTTGCRPIRRYYHRSFVVLALSHISREHNSIGLLQEGGVRPLTTSHDLCFDLNIALFFLAEIFWCFIRRKLLLLFVLLVYASLE